MFCLENIVGVQHFMDECLHKLIDIKDSEEDLKNLIPSDRIAKLVRIRLEMQAPYISKWPQALSIQVNFLFKLLNPLVCLHKVYLSLP